MIFNYDGRPEEVAKVFTLNKNEDIVLQVQFYDKGIWHFMPNDPDDEVRFAAVLLEDNSVVLLDEFEAGEKIDEIETEQNVNFFTKFQLNEDKNVISSQASTQGSLRDAYIIQTMTGETVNEKPYNKIAFSILCFDGDKFFQDRHVKYIFFQLSGKAKSDGKIRYCNFGQFDILEGKDGEEIREFFDGIKKGV